MSGTTEAMSLAADFPPQTHQAWQDLVAGVVNKSRGEDAKLSPTEAEESLRSKVPGGVVINPLYLAPDDSPALGMPGQMPFTRGRELRPVGMPWDVRQLHDDPDVALTRAAILDDLEHGVTSVWVHIGADGLAAGDLAEALADVRLDLAPVVVSSVTDQAEAADSLLVVLSGANGAGGNLGLDPISAAARTGAAADLGGLAGYVAKAARVDSVRAITVDSRVYRDAGASAVDEIAYAVATGVAYLRRLETDGVGAADAFRHIEFRVSATADQFLTTAALRALRRVWARVGELCGVPRPDRGARTHAVTALRMFTRDDPWVNVLRSTLATFGASVGGADAITVLPYDTVAGLPEKFSRRLARNTQIVLADEANVGRVTDPAGGSWYVEALTDELAAAAWTAFQEIEAAGGMPRAIAEGIVAARIAATRDEEAARIANRREPLTGVSMFPLTGETALTRRTRVSAPAGGLAPHRDSQVWEVLRDRASAYAAQHGSPPAVTVVALGSRRDFGAREMFVTNLLAAGGIVATTVEGAGTAVGEARHTGPVVLASSPKGYAAGAADAVAALRAAGTETIYVVGRARRELGETDVDGEIYDGMDVVAFLSGLLDRLGAPAEGAER